MKWHISNPVKTLQIEISNPISAQLSYYFYQMCSTFLTYFFSVQSHFQEWLQPFRLVEQVLSFNLENSRIIIISAKIIPTKKIPFFWNIWSFKYEFMSCYILLKSESKALVIYGKLQIGRHETKLSWWWRTKFEISHWKSNYTLS